MPKINFVPETGLGNCQNLFTELDVGTQKIKDKF